MQIDLQNLGKRYNRHWIFRRLSCSFTTGNRYAIVGPNGSGKSTLLQVIAGAIEKSEGTITWRHNNLPLEPGDHYQFLSLAAPYLELIEELTLSEFLEFHASFKPFVSGMSVAGIIDFVGLQEAAKKQLRYFSSGMKQRVKLAQAVFSDVPVVMLDEPTTNLDVEGVELYNRLLQEHINNRLMLVCSNDEAEIKTCNQRINIMDYKMFGSAVMREK